MSVKSATANTSAKPVLGVVVEVVAPDDRDDGSGRAAQRNGGGKLALQGLVVEASFAGDDQVCVGDVRGRSPAGPGSTPRRSHGGAEQHGGEADAAGGPRARWRGANVVGVLEAGAGEGVDEVAQARIELGDLCCGGALLGSEDGGCAGRSDQWARDVACDDELDAVRLDDVVRIDAVDAPRFSAVGASSSPGPVEEAVPRAASMPTPPSVLALPAECEYQPWRRQRRRAARMASPKP